METTEHSIAHVKETIVRNPLAHCRLRATKLQNMSKLFLKRSHRLEVCKNYILKQDQDIHSLALQYRF